MKNDNFSVNGMKQSTYGSGVQNELYPRQHTLYAIQFDIDTKDPYALDLIHLKSDMEALMHSCNEILISNMFGHREEDSERMKEAYRTQNLSIVSICSIISNMMLKRDFILNNICQSDSEPNNEEQSTVDHVLADLETLRNRMNDLCTDRSIDARELINMLDDFITNYNN